MAGEWMKVELCLPEKPEVLMVAGMLGITADEVVGKLFKVWGWASRNCYGGGVTHVTVLPHLNDLVGEKAFTDCMQKCGWLRIENDVVTFVNFDRHMSQSAKERALAQMRMAKKRSYARVTDKLRKPRNKNVTREEYSLSENTTDAPAGAASVVTNGIPKFSKCRI
jgi:hypothetical protein